MLARDMQRKVEQRLMSLEIDNRKFKSEDIFDWLNLGQNEFIKRRLDSILYENADNFAKIQKELDDLRLIIMDSEPIDPTGEESNPTKYLLPTEYQHMVRATASVEEECASKFRPVRMVSTHLIHSMLEDSLYKPTKKSLLGTLKGNILNVYLNKFTLGQAIITYIKIPRKIGVSIIDSVLVNSNCELAEHTHEDIVELAVQYAYRILNVNQNN